MYAKIMENFSIKKKLLSNYYSNYSNVVPTI